MHSHHHCGHSRGHWLMAGEDGHERGGHDRGHERGGRGFRGPFGRHRGGPFRGRGPRMFDPGALRLVVLGLIADEPRHGYDIIKALEARFQGTYSPSPGAIYPMLQMLEEADLVSSTLSGNKRLFTISDSGRSYLEENRAELDKINRQIEEMSGEASQVSVGEEIRALRHALVARMRSGTLSAEQAGRMRDILAKARADIESL